MRTRVFANVVEPWTYYATTSVSPQFVLDSGTYRSSYDTLSDHTIANFYKKAKQGKIFVNPFHRITETLKVDETSTWKREANGGVNWDVYNGPALYRKIDTWELPFFEVPPTDLEDLISLLKQETIAALDMAKYAFGEDVAELKKTLNSLKGIMSDLANAVDRMVKIVNQLRKNGYSLSRALSKAWLKARYEIRPLIITADNLIEILNKGLGKQSYERVKRASSHAENVQDTFEDMGAMNFNISLDRTVSYTLAVGVYFQNEDPRTTTLEKLGLGPKDVLPTIWAVTRFSFLVDRFINVSNMIYATQNLLDPNVGVKDGFQTVSCYFSSIGKINTIAGDATWTTSQMSFDTVEYTLSDKNRILWTPDFSDVLPTLELPGWDTWVDILSIFHGSLWKLFNKTSKALK